MWPPLKRLDLSDNALRYLPQLLISRWDWLEKLDLTNNKWSCDCNNEYLVSSGKSTIRIAPITVQRSDTNFRINLVDSFLHPFCTSLFQSFNYNILIKNTRIGISFSILDKTNEKFFIKSKIIFVISYFKSN